MFKYSILVLAPLVFIACSGSNSKSEKATFPTKNQAIVLAEFKKLRSLAETSEKVNLSEIKDNCTVEQKTSSPFVFSVFGKNTLKNFTEPNINSDSLRSAHLDSPERQYETSVQVENLLNIAATLNLKNVDKDIFDEQLKAFENFKQNKYVGVLIEQTMKNPEIIGDFLNKKFNPGSASVNIALFEYETQKLVCVFKADATNSKAVDFSFYMDKDNKTSDDAMLELKDDLHKNLFKSVQEKLKKIGVADSIIYTN